ncbi:YggS family pyridoxal phosphate-dependent enzyme [Oscillatoria sp. CS-180]|uniref:YggS family pyridoxal phosphate-dependent enzyme n=1 Tax=Oscillatoria sp. CS-180 TaxID=3021720 RepID=UPI00232B524B|nr:YggS family pyridoxal phosphate-dependent enzyme [Oscillatoria sp. CS-180]MDB9528807.1 YggS family pyridoxal phosphate-dependent enzyme [Oscillatoria sp. CS-180]
MTVSPSPGHIQERITSVKAAIPSQVRLIAVTKKQPSSCIRAAYEANIRDFGESQVQEAIAKQAELVDLKGITWHLIGHLQSNKARKALLHFDWIHSVDSLKIAARLNEIAADVQRSPYCCLQVKMVPDPPKYGFSLDDLWASLPQLDQMQHLKIAGLMTIPPRESSIEEIKYIFQHAQILAHQINTEGFNRIRINELSLGMSSDYQVAIASGSTMIRLGTTLFGDRPA